MDVLLFYYLLLLLLLFALTLHVVVLLFSFLVVVVVLLTSVFFYLYHLFFSVVVPDSSVVFIFLFCVQVGNYVVDEFVVGFHLAVVVFQQLFVCVCLGLLYPYLLIVWPPICLSLLCVWVGVYPKPFAVPVCLFYVSVPFSLSLILISFVVWSSGNVHLVGPPLE